MMATASSSSASALASGSPDEEGASILKDEDEDMEEGEEQQQHRSPPPQPKNEQSKEERAFETVFPTIETLSRNGGDSEVACPVAFCGKTFAHRGTLKMHLVKSHKMIADENDRRLVGGKAAGLLKRRSDIEKRFYCPVVDCRHHLTADAQGGDKPAVYDKDKRHFPSIFLLRKHFQRVHGPKPHVCSLCGVAFALSCDLTRHSKECGVPNQCALCGEVYFNVNSFQNHINAKHRGKNKNESLKKKKKQIPTSGAVVKPKPTKPAVILLSPLITSNQPVYVMQPGGASVSVLPTAAAMPSSLSQPVNLTSVGIGNPANTSLNLSATENLNKTPSFASGRLVTTNVIQPIVGSSLPVNSGLTPIPLQPTFGLPLSSQLLPVVNVNSFNATSAAVNLGTCANFANSTPVAIQAAASASMPALAPSIAPTINTADSTLNASASILPSTSSMPPASALTHPATASPRREAASTASAAAPTGSGRTKRSSKAKNKSTVASSSAKRKSSAETQTSKDLTIGGTLPVVNDPLAPISIDPNCLPTDLVQTQLPHTRNLVPKQSRGAQVSPRSKIHTANPASASTKEKKHNETQTKTMTIQKLNASSAKDRFAAVETPSQSHHRSDASLQQLSQQRIQSPQQLLQQPTLRRFKVAASRGTHADMRSPPRSNKAVQGLPPPLHIENSNFESDAAVTAVGESENGQQHQQTSAPPTPTSMAAMLRELDSFFESISTQTKESFLLEKSKAAKNGAVPTTTDSEEVLTGRDVTLSARVEDVGDDLEQSSSPKETFGKEEVKREEAPSASPLELESPSQLPDELLPNDAEVVTNSSLAVDGHTIFEVCSSKEVADAEGDVNADPSQDADTMTANSLHMETQTDISSQVLEGLWSLSGFPAANPSSSDVTGLQQHQQQQQHLPTRRQTSVMTHIETQTLDSEPVGFYDNNYFSHMETQTTDDLFPDLMDCLASVDADSMEDVIQCHDLHAPHVLRIFCEDEESSANVSTTSNADYNNSIACRDATTTTSNVGLQDAATLDQCVQTQRQPEEVDGTPSGPNTTTKTTTNAAITTTTLTRRDGMEEDEFMTEVNSLMDSQTQTYFHAMDFG